MTPCPICATTTNRQREGSPYWICDACGCWFQSPMPPKVYHGPQEPGVDDMSEPEREANRALAGHLFAHAMRGQPGPTLDVGCKIPVLAYSFVGHGCDACAMDGADSVAQYHGPYQDVSLVHGDFEHMPASAFPRDSFRLITLVHTFEHFYNPLDAMRKLRTIVADAGRVFIRMPDHTVPGYERDLTAHHYAIHPFFHCLASVLEILARTETFVVETFAELQPGQRDIILKPIT